MLNLLLIRSKPDWSDDQLAPPWCASAKQHLTTDRGKGGAEGPCKTSLCVVFRGVVRSLTGLR